VVKHWHYVVLADCIECWRAAGSNPTWCSSANPYAGTGPSRRTPRRRSPRAGRAGLVTDGEVRLRFVGHKAKLGRPVVIINRGTTRDDLATLKIDGGCTEA
jgi:hypothetical protein